MLEEGLDLQKKGYLNENFLFFHLKDSLSTEFQLHYHDFHKLIVFISGDVTYLIEGKFYKLKPGDIIFIAHHELHKPIVSPSALYERMVLWIKPDFLGNELLSKYGLAHCFLVAAKEQRHLLRIEESSQNHIKHLLSVFRNATKDTGFANELLRMTSFLQLLIGLNRLFLTLDEKEPLEDVIYDPRIEAILNYINLDLKKDFSCTALAQKFYLNKYYLMHLFKQQTGYSIHQYVLKKRLIKGAQLLREGVAATQVCLQCGFGDYSSFVRAFKKEFELSPRDYTKMYSPKF